MKGLLDEFGFSVRMPQGTYPAKLLAKDTARCIKPALLIWR